MGFFSKEEDERRFQITFGEDLNTKAYHGAGIICDTETGVQYLLYTFAEKVCMTPLLDKDGKPLLRKTEE